MAKRRAIDSKIRTSQTFAKLTYRQRDLWQGLIVVVDDQGRMPGDARFVRSQIWPYDDISTQEVEEDLGILAGPEQNNILLYAAKGCLYLQIINWHFYQRDAEWLGLSDYPAPAGWIDHARYHGPGNKIITLNWDTRLTTLKVGSALPSSDVNGDVNGDGDGEDEVGPHPLSAPFENAFKISVYKPSEWLAALQDLQRQGVTADEFPVVKQYMDDAGLTYSGPWSIIKTAAYIHSQRLAGKPVQYRKNGKPTEADNQYFEMK